MKNSLKSILIIGLGIILVSCALARGMKNGTSLNGQVNNENLEENTTEKNEKELNKKSNEEQNKDISEESASKADETSNNEKDEKENDESSENKAVSGKKKKAIYLTFDDGPSYKVTNNVLDILKEKNINATFFLIGNQIKGREEVVKRIHDEGNSIGLHSYTHKYKKIYSNEDSFINEMVDCRNEIKRVIGISPNIIRFPGGSCKRLSKKFLKTIHNKNFKLYDWNLENNDGLKPKTSSDDLYTKATDVRGEKERIILLLHCTDNNQNTCIALPKIIDYYKSHGYEFRIITEETKELYFPITN